MFSFFWQSSPVNLVPMVSEPVCMFVKKLCIKQSIGLIYSNTKHGTNCVYGVSKKIPHSNKGAYLMSDLTVGHFFTQPVGSIFSFSVGVKNRNCRICKVDWDCRSGKQI